MIPPHRVLHAAFTVLERAAPWLGGLWAARLWYALPAGGHRRDDRPDLPSVRSEVTMPAGQQLVAESWGPADAAPVYLVHGWGGWRGQLGSFVRPLVAGGHRVVAFDAPSHGESDAGALGPGRCTAAELMHALTATVTEHGSPAGIVAHSLGGVTTALALDDGLSTPKLVLVAPAVDPFTRMDAFAAALGFGPRVRRSLTRHLERRERRPIRDFVIANLMERIERPPLLVVHDVDDKEAPFTQGEQLAKTWPGAWFVATEGLGHRRILRDPDVAATVTQFVTR
ncbi:MAG: alpha/beta fold hydrolase [Streptosporangiales bacterium]|nr:alpha/beta fold hydrolase [Streptosporangiales bacterium]MBO0890190.1 alpha/beta fold hydrolase [Acidothermales bacterium]